MLYGQHFALLALFLSEGHMPDSQYLEKKKKKIRIRNILTYYKVVSQLVHLGKIAGV